MFPRPHRESQDKAVRELLLPGPVFWVASAAHLKTRAAWCPGSSPLSWKVKAELNPIRILQDLQHQGLRGSEGRRRSGETCKPDGREGGRDAENSEVPAIRTKQGSAFPR